MNSQSQAIIIAFAGCLLFAGCVASDEISQRTVHLTGQEEYSYDFEDSFGDEDGVVIVKQAEHFSISQIDRNMDSNWQPRYRYQPAPGFSGRDVVELETRRGSDGASPPTDFTTIRIVFIISATQ